MRVTLLRTAPQLAVCPLTQLYVEWHHVSTMMEWMDRMLTLSYCLLGGVREANFSSRDKIVILPAEVVEDHLLR